MDIMSVKKRYSQYQVARTNATLFATRITPQRVLATETGGKRAFFEGVHDGVWRSEKVFEHNPHS